MDSLPRTGYRGCIHSLHMDCTDYTLPLRMGYRGYTHRPASARHICWMQRNCPHHRGYTDYSSPLRKGCKDYNRSPHRGYMDCIPHTGCRGCIWPQHRGYTGCSQLPRKDYRGYTSSHRGYTPQRTGCTQPPHRGCTRRPHKGCRDCIHYTGPIERAAGVASPWAKEPYRRSGHCPPLKLHWPRSSSRLLQRRTLHRKTPELR